MDFNADFVGADDWVCKKYVNELEIPGNKGEESSGSGTDFAAACRELSDFSGGLYAELPVGWFRNFAKFPSIGKLRAGICGKQQGSA
jgi:hypothetical protein